jgi:hypothetical protein
MLDSPCLTRDNLDMAPDSLPERDAFPQVISADGSLAAFRPGALVLVTLQSPREKFFGSVLSLAPFGLVFCGIPLDSIDDFIAQLRDGEHVRPSTLFFPMHRIERLEIDQRSGEFPSISERFQAKSGIPAQRVFHEEAAG